MDSNSPGSRLNTEFQRPATLIGSDYKWRSRETLLGPSDGRVPCLLWVAERVLLGNVGVEDEVTSLFSSQGPTNAFDVRFVGALAVEGFSVEPCRGEREPRYIVSCKRSAHGRQNADTLMSATSNRTQTDSRAGRTAGNTVNPAADDAGVLPRVPWQKQDYETADIEEALGRGHGDASP